MLTQVKIKNFKSIRDLEFSRRRVNVFIGEPNSGKSNILEALAFFSPGTFENAKEVLRFKETADLFYDQKVTNEILVEIGNWKMTLQFKFPNFTGSVLWRSLDGNSEIPKWGFSMDSKNIVSHSVLDAES